MKMLNTNPYINTVRLDFENNIIKLDFRTKPTVKVPRGKKGNRFRFSTGFKDTKKNRELIEKKKFPLSQEYYESLFEVPQYKKVILFSDIAYVALKEAESERKKEDGTKDYLNILGNDVLPIFGELNLKEIKVRDIRAWILEMSEQDISQSRFNKKYYVLKRVLDYALENEYIESNPINLVKRSSKLFSKPKDKSTNYFSKEERSKILNDTCENGSRKDTLDYPFINAFMHVALLTGARTGEIIALKIEDIDFTNNTITFQRSIRKGVIAGTKTGKTRTVPMVNALVVSLKKWIGLSTRTWLFPKTTIDKPYSDSRTIVDKYYKPLLERLNLSYRILYNTRHSFASVAVENKVPVSVVSRCLGHSTISTTEKFYLQFGNVDQDDVRSQLESLTA